MLLAVDVGNTQTHLGAFHRGELAHEWRASTDPTRTADELALMFGQFLSLADLSFSRQITGVAISSVVPRATQELREMTSRYFGFDSVVVEPGVKTGIAILTDNPREVGADRIANAVAAHDLFPDEAVVIVDFGTAITVDAVSAKGEYLGGAIAPGIETAATALFSTTALIRRVELVEPPGSAIGKSTVTSVQSGIIYGTAGLVDALIEKIVDELGEDARVIATGGLAPVLLHHCRHLERLEPTLTLEGLRIIYERNAEGAR
ncbi:MAG: type pantothenate kinase [Actinomycetota bacterium]|jgi:type III pantothenate kinase|nr:type pantothenate kinase [Actinomycetota bacterium]